jgi:hypothetical protein
MAEKRKNQFCLIIAQNIPLGNILRITYRYNAATMQRNVIGSRVRQARLKSSPRISQLDLVARLQVQGLKIEQPALSKIENGRRPVLDIEILALAQALGVSVAWLFGETDLPPSPVK